MTESSPSVFRYAAHKVSLAVGSPVAFAVACVLVVTWAAVGPLFHYSDSWQLTINTGTTIITFLMVFVIQNTQNRDSQVMHLKLDELIRAVRSARNELVDMEDLSDEELRRLQRQFAQMRLKAESKREAKE
jgi:low affinity Fe/Cu permease